MAIEKRQINRYDGTQLIVVHPETEASQITDFATEVAKITVNTATNATKLGGQLPSYYLSWSNFTDKPTTIAGYGITNAYTKEEIVAQEKVITDSVTSLTSTVNGKADKATTLAGYGITDAYTKKETDAAITSAISVVYKYKGSVATYADLPTTGNDTGDVWNVVAAYEHYPAGTNWAWSGTAWDSLGGSVDLTAYKTWIDTQAYLEANYQPLDADLTAIADLTGTTGFLKKTAADTWVLDTNTYLTTHQYRPIQMNGTEILALANASALNLKAGNNISLTNVDGTITINGSNSYILPVATAGALGGIKIGYANSGANYGVVLDANNKAYVVHTNSGVTAGTYTAVTVDAQGHTTSGGNAIEWGTAENNTQSALLATNGLFFKYVA